MAAQNENSEGCLWLFSAIIKSVIIFSLLISFLELPNSVALIIAIILSIAITTMWVGIPKIKAIVRILFALVIVLFGTRFITTLLKSNITNKTFSSTEGVQQKMIFKNNDSILVYESQRVWKDYYGDEYMAKVQVRDKDFKRLYNHIKNYTPNSPSNFWGGLYAYLDKKDSPALDLLIQEFTQINTDKGLNQIEFANMVVSFVQDIPYALVFEGDCLPPHRYENTIREILEDCPECCIGNVMYGIQNSVSFLQNLKGDCDTRTVLIYSILKSFGFDVAILNSDFYLHSIIGINLPGKGTHKIYNGKKYLLWETTAPFFEAGNMAGNFNNVTYWDVVLTSK